MAYTRYSIGERVFHKVYARYIGYILYGKGILVEILEGRKRVLFYKVC